MEGKPIILVILIDLFILFRISSHFFIARLSDRFGIITTVRALVMEKGRKRRGITMPDIMPKSPMASSCGIPPAVSLWGIRMEFAADIKEWMRRVAVMGSAMAIMLPAVFFRFSDTSLTRSLFILSYHADFPFAGMLICLYCFCRSVLQR